MKILLADSDRDLLRSYGKLLAMDGHEVTTAFDGAQVAALLAGGPYGMAILEQDLPRVAHDQLMRMLRREGLPVIVLLERRVGVKQLMSASLPEAYLPLPFLPAELTALIGNVEDKLKSGRVFACGDAIVDVSNFRFEGTDTRLTAAEIDLLSALAGQEPIRGRRARTLVQAINEKLKRLGRAARIEYELQKGYRLVNRHE